MPGRVHCGWLRACAAACKRSIQIDPAVVSNRSENLSIGAGAFSLFRMGKIHDEIFGIIWIYLGNMFMNRYDHHTCSSCPAKSQLKEAEAPLSRSLPTCLSSVAERAHTACVQVFRGNACVDVQDAPQVVNM